MCPTSLCPPVSPASHVESAIPPGSERTGHHENGIKNKSTIGGQEQQQQYKREPQDVNRNGGAEDENEHENEDRSKDKIENMMMMNSNGASAGVGTRPSVKLDFRLFFGSLFDNAQQRQSESAGRFNLLMDYPPQRVVTRPSARHNGTYHKMFTSRIKRTA